LWREFWYQISEMGSDGIQIKKCKGHATDADVFSGASSVFLRAGNDHAEYYAGKGVDIEEEEVPAEAARQAYTVARQWYTWLAAFVEDWPDDTQPMVVSNNEPTVKVVLPFAPLLLHPTQPHEFIVVSNRWECMACHRATKEDAPRLVKQRLAHTACLGSVVSRSSAVVSQIGAQSFGRGHNLYKSGSVVWCKECGCYGESQPKELLKVCTGPAKGTRKYFLSRLLRGEHPRKSEVLETAVRL
jgi:hypothetical protein